MIERHCSSIGLLNAYQVYQAATDELLERNKKAVGRLIDTCIGDEPSSFTDFIDDNGHGVGPWAITCSMKKTDGKLVFDFDGTSPQSETSINFYLSHTMLKMFIGYFLLVSKSILSFSYLLLLLMYMSRSLRSSLRRK